MSWLLIMLGALALSWGLVLVEAERTVRVLVDGGVDEAQARQLLTGRCAAGSALWLLLLEPVRRGWTAW
jgi:hypothetical protein